MKCARAPQYWNIDNSVRKIGENAEKDAEFNFLCESELIDDFPSTTFNLIRLT